MRLVPRVLLGSLLFLWAGCTDTSETEEHVRMAVQERVPIALSVAGVSVDVTRLGTRAAADIPDERLQAGEEVGLYIVLDTDYERALQGLPLRSAYRYVNVRGVVQADGSIAVSDTALYYPMAQASKVAVVAYSPYCENLSESILHRGELLSVAANQTTQEALQASDLLVGVPTVGNPFRHTRADSTDPVATPIAFSHAYSKIHLTLDIIGVGGIPLYDSIFVEVREQPLQARVNPLVGTIAPVPESKGTLQMLAGRYVEGQCRGDTLTFRVSAIVFPQDGTSSTSPEFAIRLKGRFATADTTIVRVDTQGTTFEAGRERRYTIRLKDLP